MCFACLYAVFTTAINKLLFFSATKGFPFLLKVLFLIQKQIT